MAQLFALMPYLESGWNVINLEHRYPGVTLAPAALQNSGAPCAGLSTTRRCMDSTRQSSLFPEHRQVHGLRGGGDDAASRALGRSVSRQRGRQSSGGCKLVWHLGFCRLLQGPNKKAYAAGWVQNLPNPLEVRECSPRS